MLGIYGVNDIKKENMKNQYSIFNFIDISEIKIKNIAPRYSEQNHIYNHKTLRYYATPFYDVYTCVEDRYGEYKISGYTVVPKNYFLTVEELEKKYCQNKQKHQTSMLFTLQQEKSVV